MLTETQSNPRSPFAHLSDPGLLLRLTSIDIVISDDSTEEPVRRKRKPSVASVIRQMQRAGVEIAGCEINPRDGTVKVISGKPVGDLDMDSTTASPDPKWN